MHGFHQQVKQEVDTRIVRHSTPTYINRKQHSASRARAVPMLGYQWQIWLIVTMIRSSVLEESINHHISSTALQYDTIYNLKLAVVAII